MPPPRQDQDSGPGGTPPAGESEEFLCRPVPDLDHLDQVLEEALPAFGGALLRQAWLLLDEAIGRGVPMTLAVAGPVTVSGQHYTWLNPLLETGWFVLLSTTDAVCYHDGHRALDGAAAASFRRVPIHGDDGRLRDEEIIRVTDVGFPEDILLRQDAFLRELLRRPEFQRRMSGTELRHLLGKAYAELEARNGVPEGLLALCARMAIPVFVGAPADGSVFLNSVRLWAEARLGGPEHAFELDLHQEVFESCAIHRWGLLENEARSLGTLVLGGGVPKNFNLQPEPALSQVLGFEEIGGYLYDIQITTAPVTDGSLSSCPPAEAVTWGKVDRHHYRRTTVSVPADYTMLMPFLVKALLAKRERLRVLEAEIGLETLLATHPEARGYLRPSRGYRLYERLPELVETLLDDLRRVRARQGEAGA